MNQNEKTEPKLTDVCKVTLKNGRYSVIDHLDHFRVSDDKELCMFFDMTGNCVFYVKPDMIESIQLLKDKYGNDVTTCHVYEPEHFNVKDDDMDDEDDESNDVEGDEAFLDLMEELENFKTCVHNMVAHHE